MGLAANCSKIWKDDKLSINRTNYTGNQLKIQGYYYLQKNQHFYDIYCFYNNGIALAAGGLFLSVVEMDDYLNREFINNNNYQKYKYNWGAYTINNATIQFERWYPSDPPLKAYVREGTILNDSTFTISSSYRIKDGNKTEVEARNETYHFKAFSPKPDSTNSFVQ